MTMEISSSGAVPEVQKGSEAVADVAVPQMPEQAANGTDVAKGDGKKLQNVAIPLTPEQSPEPTNLTSPPAKVTPLKVLVPNSLCGLIIGRAGQTIKELELQSGARIIVASEDTMVPGSKERVVTISGTLEANQKAQYLISCKLQEASQPKLPVGANPATAAIMKTYVPHALVGFLIGRNGATIKEIESESGSKITISPEHEMKPGETERLVTITGSAENNTKCHDAIRARLQQAEKKPAPSAPLAAFAPTYAPYINGYPMATYPTFQPVSFAPSFSMSPPLASPRDVTGTGLYTASQSGTTFYSAPGAFAAPAAGGYDSNATVAMGSNLLGTTYYTQPPIFGDVPPPLPQPQAYMSVPAHLVGFVIGKGGCTVREIQHKSGARVDVATDGPTNALERVVTITGGPASIQAAQLLIQSKLDEAASRPLVKQAGGQ
eukprot:Colp12_sorted_trinity150504_noHs@30861